MLRHDKDAAWRSDVLTVLSDRARSETGDTGVVIETGQKIARRSAAFEATTLGPTTSSGAAFGKPLDFKSNYYRP